MYNLKMAIVKPKHVVNTIYTPLPSNKVVLDKYIHSTVVYESNGDDEPYNAEK